MIEAESKAAAGAPAVAWKKSAARDYFESICIAVIFALFVRTFVVQAFKIPSSSMEDNLLIGDHILVNKFAYGARSTGRGRLGRAARQLERLLPYRPVVHQGVVVFKYPKEPRRDFIKRVIGVPGDEIAVRRGQVWRNGEAIDQRSYVTVRSPRAGDDAELLMQGDNMLARRLGEREYFMMGDNRLNSDDSRSWGVVPAPYIKGRALLIYWSFEVPDSCKRLDVEVVSRPVDRLLCLGYTMLHLPTRTRWSRTFRMIR